MAGEKSKWTVMVFMGVANLANAADMTQEAQKDLAELQAINPHPGLNIFVQKHDADGSVERYSESGTGGCRSSQTTETRDEGRHSAGSSRRVSNRQTTTRRITLFWSCGDTPISSLLATHGRLTASSRWTLGNLSTSSGRFKRKCPLNTQTRGSTLWVSMPVTCR